MRYQILSELGCGGYGAVYKALDNYRHQLVAVKIMVQEDEPDESWERSMAAAMRGEAIILPALNHQHIIRAFYSKGWGTPRVGVVMELMEGSLASLMRWPQLPRKESQAVADIVLHQMLQALAYLASLGYVHRDLKPENILYTSSPSLLLGRPRPHPVASSLYHFRLGDFGLCDLATNIDAVRGSELYMAPELFERPVRHMQSHKSDVWALYVTIFCTLNADEMRQMRNGRRETVADFAKAVELDGRIGSLREMAMVDPEERATAEEMLEKVYPYGRGQLSRLRG
ncbi:kinase-like domain-containing protein [Achaetomium macrosporum]|uniref:Kinase-like domain-containing protein n=1 Tax=Achaetomium macrosporum TaxID=79813 RepID=A0AAN7CFA0_9PEZI|nr:kinase-like domain-containing protein [Achaetomium macrosporum]